LTKLVNLVYICTVNPEIMKIVSLTQNTSGSLLRKVAALNPISDFKNPILLKSVGTYLVDALGEGLKQNFLGSDINMEFLTLTIRVYLIRFIKSTVSYPEYQVMDQYSEKRNNMSNISDDNRSTISLKLTA
jgi:hypothetical protein